ncbi:MAG: hypothetical protein IKS28_07765 [Clostridia bacterium]|nr:hypothetical protein [Clostridia bacterium]
MKKVISCVVLIALCLTLILSSSAFDVTDSHALFDFKTLAGDTNEALLISNNTIGGDGTVGAVIENGLLHIAGGTPTGILFVSYLKPNTWGATDFGVNLNALRYLAFRYKTDSTASLFFYYETGAVEGDGGVSYSAGKNEWIGFPATDGEFSTVVVAVPENATGNLTHFRIDWVGKDLNADIGLSDLYIESVGFFASENEARSYFEKTESQIGENDSPATSDYFFCILGVLFAVLAVFGVVFHRKNAL